MDAKNVPITRIVPGTNLGSNKINIAAEIPKPNPTELCIIAPKNIVKKHNK